jgi:hypothetical protein
MGQCPVTRPAGAGIHYCLRLSGHRGPHRDVDDVQWIPWPAERPPRTLGGVTCDMLRGPCACGATHRGDE